MGTTTTSGPGGMPMMSIGMEGGDDMDAMMKKMMDGMKMGGSGGEMMSFGGDMGSMMSSGSKSFSSSSSTMMSSSSSSTSSSKMIGGMSGMMGGGMQMPSMFDKMGAGVDFEELSTAGTDISGPPAYTVTSPRPSVDNTASGL